MCRKTLYLCQKTLYLQPNSKYFSLLGGAHMLTHKFESCHNVKIHPDKLYSVYTSSNISAQILTRTKPPSQYGEPLFLCIPLLLYYIIIWPEVKTQVFPVFKYASLVNLCFVILCKYSSHEFTFSSIFRLAEKCRKEGQGNILDKVGTYEPP